MAATRRERGVQLGERRAFALDAGARAPRAAARASESTPKPLIGSLNTPFRLLDELAQLLADVVHRGERDEQAQDRRWCPRRCG